MPKALHFKRQELSFIPWPLHQHNREWRCLWNMQQLPRRRINGDGSLTNSIVLVSNGQAVRQFFRKTGG